MVDPFQILENANTSSTTAASESVEILILNKQKMNEKKSIDNNIIFVKTPPATEEKITKPQSTIINESSKEAEEKNVSDKQQQHSIMGGHSSNETNLIVLPPQSTIGDNSPITTINHHAAPDDTDKSTITTINDDIDIIIGSNKNNEQNFKNNLKLVYNKKNSTITTKTISNSVIVKNNNETTENEQNLTVCSSSSGSSNSDVSVINSLLTNNDEDDVISNINLSKNNNVNSECMNLDVNSIDNKIESHQQQSIINNIIMMDENSHHHSSGNNRPMTTDTTTTTPPMVDNRKVEPLKINLHRDPIILKLPKTPSSSSTTLNHDNCTSDIISSPTIPKITIKPIPKPSVILSQSSSSIVNSTATTSIVVTSDNALTATSSANNISSSSDDYKVSTQSLDPPQEPHIVPKLTIRNSANASGSGSQSVIVPKLTIKMDNHLSSASLSQQSNNSNSSNIDNINVSGSGNVKLSIKPILEPPIPKLTIKTNSEDHTEMIIVNNSNSSNLKYTLNTTLSGSNSPVTRATSKSQTKQLSSTTVEPTVPKLKIKPIVNPDASDNSSTKNAALDKTSTEDVQLIKTVPKLVVRVPKESNITTTATVVDLTSPAENEQTSSEFEEDDIPNVQKTSNDSPCIDTVPKLTIRQVKDPEKPPEENIVIPKVTIKPIVNPDDDSHQDTEMLVTPKITIKPIPKPLDITQPLEVVTNFPIASSSVGSSHAAPSLKSSISKLESPADGQQQSPRIILKINKQNVNKLVTTENCSSDVIELSDSPNTLPLIHSNELPLETIFNQDVKVSSSCSSSGSGSSSSSACSNSSSSNTINSSVYENPLKRPASSFKSTIVNYNIDTGSSNAKKSKLDTNNSVNLLIPMETIDLLDDDSPEHDPKTMSIDLLMTQKDKMRQTAVAAATAVLPPTISVSMVKQCSTVVKNLSANHDNEKISEVKEQTLSRIFRDTKKQELDGVVIHRQSNSSVLSPAVTITEIKKSIVVTEPTKIPVTTSPSSSSSSSSSSSISSTTVTAAPVTAKTNPIVSSSLPKINDQKPRLEFSSSLFPKYFSDEPVAQQSIQMHPLLLQNIERAKLLEAMRNPKPMIVETSLSADSGVTATITSAKDIFSMSEGSSSDCIVIEDNGSQPFGTATSFVASIVDPINKNGRRDGECSVDRDSGVDVSNSLKSSSEELQVDTRPTIKRGRGRPRKDVLSSATTKTPVEEEPKRKFAGVSSVQQNAVMTITTPSIANDAKISIEPQISILSTPKQHVRVQLTPLKPETPPPIVSTAVTVTTSLPNTISTSTNSMSFTTTSTAAIEFIDVSPQPSINATTEIVGESIDITDTPIGLMKEKKRRMRIDDDDESPTFNPMSSGGTKRGRGRGGRGSRGRGRLRGNQRNANNIILSSPDKSRDGGSSSCGIFTTPKSMFKDTCTLQVFEEDTRMSANDTFTTPMRNSEFLHNEESQSSILSTASATVESTTTTKKRGKIEVTNPEGKTEFTVDMIAEYDWPPPKGCCPSRNRDTFMIQEQIAEYLGVKSFKRKYQDLQRRPVDMEERNYLMEKGMVSEKMCDLGLTAVLASDVLDIMHNDFYEKYEEYKKYLREKHIKDLSTRQKAMQADAVEKNLSAREHAIRAASSWNINFNKSRKEDRRECLDLQNFVIQIPEATRKKMNRPYISTAHSNYPVALVPGQFQEYYRKYSAAELLCYPINTAIADPIELDKRLRNYSLRKMKKEEKDDDDDSSSSSSSSDDDDDDDDSDTDSSDSSEDENVNSETKATNKCRVCNKLQNANRDNKPEIFVTCSTCLHKAHPSCIEMPTRMQQRVNEYAWQCSECKTCLKCRHQTNKDKMLYCDQCDRGYHIYCIGLQIIPPGRWHCGICSVCTNCGIRQPEGPRKPNLTNQQYKKLAAASKWTHEYRINHVSNLREHYKTLCVPCSKLRIEVT